MRPNKCKRILVEDKITKEDIKPNEITKKFILVKFKLLIDKLLIKFFILTELKVHKLVKEKITIISFIFTNPIKFVFTFIFYY